MLGNLTNNEIEEVLKKSIVGRIGCNDGEKTYVVPINYVYDGKQIIAHSLEGMKINMMRKNPKVCFEVDEMKNGTNWKTVITWGTYQEFTNERERRTAMKEFIDKMLKLKISHTAHPPGMTTQKFQPGHQSPAKPVIYRIILHEKTGRFESD
jgi:uncharacterized protein